MSEFSSIEPGVGKVPIKLGRYLDDLYENLFISTKNYKKMKI